MSKNSPVQPPEKSQETPICEYINSYAPLTCFEMYNCCDCGGNDCGCGYCFSCHACSVCLSDN